jgi:hypothetical protein
VVVRWRVPPEDEEDEVYALEPEELARQVTLKVEGLLMVTRAILALLNTLDIVEI